MPRARTFFGRRRGSRCAEARRGFARSGVSQFGRGFTNSFPCEEVPVVAKPGERRPWPATLPAQVKAVAEVLTAARAPLADNAIAACFTGRGAWKKRLPQIIDTLVAVGRVRRRKDGIAVIA